VRHDLHVAFIHGLRLFGLGRIDCDPGDPEVLNSEAKVNTANDQRGPAAAGLR